MAAAFAAADATSDVGDVRAIKARKHMSDHIARRLLAWSFGETVNPSSSQWQRGGPLTSVRDVLRLVAKHGCQCVDRRSMVYKKHSEIETSLFLVCVS